jgi:predicted nucleotide-binding protein
MFLTGAGGEVFSVEELTAAVSNPKFDSRAAVGALRSLQAAGRVEPRPGGWRVSGEPVIRYHVRVVPVKAADRLAGPICAYDLTHQEMLEGFVAPYQEQRPIAVDGRELHSYRKPKITTTGASGGAAVAKIASNLRGEDLVENRRRAEKLFFEKSSKDVTADYIEPGEPATVDTSPVHTDTPSTPTSADEIFIVHGHSRRDEVAHFLQNATRFRPVVLAEKPGKGRTIIEKFEQESRGSGFAVVLLTADDLGRSKLAAESELASRARQNVVLELGYFIGKLGRDRVVALYEEGVELPSDYNGVEFIPFIEGWQLKLIRELRAAGFEIDTDGL